MPQKRVKVYLTSTVWRDIADHPKVSPEFRKRVKDAWNRLEEAVELKVSAVRFPPEEEIRKNIVEWGARIVGCHLSHPITEDMLTDPSCRVFAVCTSTAGYNHIAPVPGIIITHTPGVLHRTVADFTIAIILANLRNIVGLHNFVWNGEWKPEDKWDLDDKLSTTMDNLTLGIVGMGEIGREVTRRLAPWGIKIKYYDVRRNTEIEHKYSNVEFVPELGDIFSSCDIVSLHVPLLPATYHMVNEDLLKKMKKGALLVNTARGPIVDSEALMNLLESGEISVNLSFDVHEEEPIPPDKLERWRKIAEKRPELRFVFIPHNASADADTRARMAEMFLTDIYKIAVSRSPEDLKDVHLIPEQRYLLGKGDKEPDFENYRIYSFWNG